MINKYYLYIESFQDFPKEGVIFWDSTPLLENPCLFKQAILELKNYFLDKKITKIAAVESKGFAIGSALAYEMGKPLCLIRKPHLTPGEVLSEKFEKEYGFSEYEIKKNLFNPSDQILIVYDILAAPGATQAAIYLVEQTGAKVVGCAYLIELAYLNGRQSLEKYDLFSLVKIQEKRLR